MIVWLVILVSGPVAHASRVVSDVGLAATDDDPTPPRPRSRGPPLPRWSGHRTARLAGNATIQTHFDLGVCVISGPFGGAAGCRS